MTVFFESHFSQIETHLQHSSISLKEINNRFGFSNGSHLSISLNKFSHTTAEPFKNFQSFESIDLLEILFRLIIKFTKSWLIDLMAD